MCPHASLRLSLYSPCLRGNGKEVLAEKSLCSQTTLSLTHTHTHTPNILPPPFSLLAQQASQPDWHEALPPSPAPQNTRACARLPGHCQHPPASCRVPLPLRCSNKRPACQPIESPWGAVAQPLLLALRSSLGTCLASPSTTSRSQAGRGLTTSRSNQFPELSSRWTATSGTSLPLLFASWGPFPQHPLGAPA